MESRHRHVEVFDHASDQELLLVVFLTEDREVRADQLEQLENDRGDATKVARPARALEDVGKTGYFDERR